MRDRVITTCRRLLTGDWNPVLVKELRQSVRSRFIVAVLVLFLVLLVIVSGAFLLTTTVRRMMAPGSVWAPGSQLFAVLMLMLSAAAVMVPAYVARRLSLERQAESVDLMFTSTLSPGAIVRGKFLAGLAVTGLLVFLALPFLVFTFLMRGVDVPTILTALWFLMAGESVLLMAAILGGAIPGGKALKNLLWVGVFIGLLWLVPVAAVQVFDSRGPVFSGGSLGLDGLGLTAAVSSTLVVILYAFAAFMLAPVRANRFLPLRLVLTAVWALWGLGLLAAAFIRGEEEFALVWYALSVVAFLFMTMVSVSQREQMSRRVARAIPRSPWRRALAAPFHTDPVSGLLWAVAIPALTLTATAAVQHLLGTAYDHAVVWHWTVAWLYGCCYCLTGAFINRVCIPGKVTSGASWVIVVYLLALGMLLPSILTELHDRRRISWFLATEYGNIFAMAKEDQRAVWDRHLYFALGWLGLCLMINLHWLTAHAGRFLQQTQAEAAVTTGTENGGKAE